MRAYMCVWVGLERALVCLSAVVHEFDSGHLYGTAFVTLVTYGSGPMLDQCWAAVGCPPRPSGGSLPCVVRVMYTVSSGNTQYK